MAKQDYETPSVVVYEDLRDVTAGMPSEGGT
jgi:hypothetical protein